MTARSIRVLVLLAALLSAACGQAAPPPAASTATPVPTEVILPTSTPDYDATPLPERAPFQVGEKLAYTTQTGDMLHALAAHFNTTEDEILALNPGLPVSATLEVGLPLSIPAYWFPLGGSPYKIIPDSEFVFGPTSQGVDIEQFVADQPGYLRTLSAFVAGQTRTAAQTVVYVAEQYSVNPRLLLALMEWRTGALSKADVPADVRENPYGPIPHETGLYAQSAYVAETMTTGYYGWRTGELTTLMLPDSTTSRPDMYQTAGTLAVQYLFAQWFDYDAFNAATGPDGFGPTYIRLWGNPFDRPASEQVVIPGNLTQPELTLPFLSNQTWTLTGGPHPVWGDYTPWAALDLAPAGAAGCSLTAQWVTASAPGVVVRSGENAVLLDLDGDGFEGTGWVLFHFHIEDDGRAPVGAVLNAGDPLGHPSCEGGVATGTHVHIARKYNGEWIPADGLLPGIVPFVLGGWAAARGDAPYEGRLMRVGTWAEACTCSTVQNKIYWAK